MLTAVQIKRIENLLKWSREAMKENDLESVMIFQNEIKLIILKSK